MYSHGVPKLYHLLHMLVSINMHNVGQELNCFSPSIKEKSFPHQNTLLHKCTEDWSSMVSKVGAFFTAHH